MAGKLDYRCTTCGRIYRGPHANKGFYRSVLDGIPATNGFCPRCEAEGRQVMERARAAGGKPARAFWEFAFQRSTAHFPGGTRAPGLRRASQPNPFRSRSEPIKRVRKVRKVKSRRRR